MKRPAASAAADAAGRSKSSRQAGRARAPPGARARTMHSLRAAPAEISLLRCHCCRKSISTVALVVSEIKDAKDGRGRSPKSASSEANRVPVKHNASSSMDHKRALTGVRRTWGRGRARRGRPVLPGRAEGAPPTERLTQERISRIQLAPSACSADCASLLTAPCTIAVQGPLYLGASPRIPTSS